MLFTESLKKNEEFRKVYNKGKSCANRYLVMYLLKMDGPQNRLGISVSKKVGNSVVRHRITRLIRECYRLHENEFQKGYWIVVIARNAAKGIDYQKMEKALLHLADAHRILCHEENND